MYKEASEAPNCIIEQLASNKSKIDSLSLLLRNRPPSLVMTCARGSSGHAATYAKYLIETHVGIPTMCAAPSVSSVFATKQSFHGVLFLAISQSGQSPDILASSQAAKNGGALVVALVNDCKSPLAQLSDIVIPLHAGVEKSVAATKTFICTLTAIAYLVAKWEQNDDLVLELGNLPQKLEDAFRLDWSLALPMLESAQSLFVVSRGIGLSIAREAALKFKETCCLHAEAFSAAEVQHGPMAIVQKDYPVLMFSMQDKTQRSIDDIAQTFIQRKAQILTAGQLYEKTLALDSVGCAAAELRPIILIQSFYKFVNALSLRRSYDPDNPSYIKKITETF